MKKILVIEDEESVRSSLLDMLEAEDFEVVGAENGLIGVGLARKVQPDLIICDIMMPEIDGYNVLNILNNELITASIPFIFLSAKADMTDLRTGMKLGADDYLTKPFTRTELLGAIDTRLSKKAALSDNFQKKLVDLNRNLNGSLPQALSDPLSNIIMSSFLLQESILDPEQVKSIANGIQASGERLSRLIRKFLLFTELELISTDQEKIKQLKDSSTASPKEVITNLVQEMGRKRNRLADLELALQDFPVKIGTHRLENLAREILENAFQYSKAGTQIRIVAMPVKKMLVLYFIDKGYGISSEYIKKLQSEPVTEYRVRNDQQNGMGLLIAKLITELHGGEFGIESIPAQKTIIRVSLPMA